MTHHDHRANEPPLADIIEVLRPQVEKIEDGFRAILETLDGLSLHLRGGGAVSRAVAPATAAVVPVAQPTMLPPAATFPPAVSLPPVANLPPMPAVAPPVQNISGAGGDWSKIIFGDLLHTLPATAGLSGALLADVFADDGDAICLMGQLLGFRVANAERMARLSKELGEAFYRWRPTSDAACLNALIAWVEAMMARRGLENKIEIVQIGDRYDMQRHNAKERGVEICDVFGWVILRENGKVFSKANVSVR
jgi:hypothetical protein